MATALADPLAASRTLRRELSAERTRLVVEQADLRRKATSKFACALHMFFTRRALEQATGELLARYKAARFADFPLVADLCCGIGGDAIGIAGVSSVAGYDLDLALVEFARANFRVNQAQADIHCADVTALDLSQFNAWHLDPDRRIDGRRSVDLENHQPDRKAIERMLASNPHAGIKLAPATRLPDDWSPRCELEWIGHRRECKQLVAWHGKLAQQSGMRRATSLGNSGEVATFLAAPTQMPTAAAALSHYLYEPDPALLAADLTGAAAEQFGLRPLAAGAVYLSSDELISPPLLTAFEVLAVEPWSERRLSEMLAAHAIGPLEVKKRGVDIDPARIAARNTGQGTVPGVVILTRRGKQVLGILAKRVG